MEVFGGIPGCNERQIETGLRLIYDGLQTIGKAEIRGQGEVEIRSIPREGESEMVFFCVERGEVLPSLLCMQRA